MTAARKRHQLLDGIENDQVGEILDRISIFLAAAQAMTRDELDEAILAATAHEMREDDPARRMAVHLLTIVLQQELARR